MQLSKNVFSFALLASVLSVGTGYAQQLVKFHLPVPVKWGNTTMEPGDYKMEVPSSAVCVQSVCMKNAQRAVVVLPLARTEENQAKLSDKSYLQLLNVNGTYFVRKFTSGVTGRTILFSVPKVHNDMIAQNTTEIEGSN